VNVLLLHPEDPLTTLPAGRWDLIVDLARAPAERYRQWSHQVDCQVISLYDFAEEVEDLYRLRQLLRPWMMQVVDGHGIDWWDVLSLEMAPAIQQLMLIRRLAQGLDGNCRLFMKRSHFLASALQDLLRVPLRTAEAPLQTSLRRVRRYGERFAQLDSAAMKQVIRDKIEARNIMPRFRLTRRHRERPAILLPTAYVNGSRMALAYAAQLPDCEFILAATRRCGPHVSLPPNVQAKSLRPYFGSVGKSEIATLRESWERVRGRLVGSDEMFRVADRVGVFRRIPALLRWGVGLRDAWNRFFEHENISGCLCTDDSNPPTRIPLLLAKKRGLPALACHHGALDYAAAFKTHHPDCYIAKTEMEQDYLLHIGQVDREKIIAAAPQVPDRVPRFVNHASEKDWLVFFTEPYANFGWRVHEVYADLLPRLCWLAQACGLKLVFKLHPFESIKGFRRILGRYLPKQQAQIEVISGAPSDQLWTRIRFALTVQSSIALESTALGIPVFLCAWLRDGYSGYVGQYARFGVGRVLETPGEFKEIPRLLRTQNVTSFARPTRWRTIGPTALASLFSGNLTFPFADCC